MSRFDNENFARIELRALELIELDPELTFDDAFALARTELMEGP
jgi:hypothetical protein